MTRKSSAPRIPGPGAPALTPFVLLAYGVPILGIAYLLFFVQFYFLKFATDELLLPPAAVGMLFGLAKAWDAISNPLVGSWSDRSRSRWGRRRPFLLAALPLLAIGFVMLWRTPEPLGSGALVAWSGAALFVFYGAFALYTIPHVALGAELSRDSDERTRLFAARQMAFTVGILVAFAAIQVVMNADDARAATARLAIPSVLGAALLLAWTPLAIREPPPQGRSGGKSLLSGLRDVAGNPYARRLLFVWFVENAGMGAVGTMAPYIAEYLLGRPDVVGTLPGAYVVAGVVSIPLWVRLSRRLGKRETWLGAMLLAAAAFGGFGFVGEGDVAMAVALLFVAGSAMGCGSVLSSAIMADVIDLDAHRTGERKEGIYSAAMMFMMKIGMAGSTALSGFVLSATGFVPNVEQSAESLFGMRLLFGWLPCLGFLAGAMIFWRMPAPEPQPAAGSERAVDAKATRPA